MTSRQTVIFLKDLVKLKNVKKNKGTRSYISILKINSKGSMCYI